MGTSKTVAQVREDEAAAVKPAPKPAARRAEKTEWLVQMRKSVEGAQDWTDVDILDVPAGTHRATVLEKAKALPLGLEVGQRALLRLIPKAEIVEESIALVQPPAQLVIGDAG